MYLTIVGWRGVLKSKLWNHVMSCVMAKKNSKILKMLAKKPPTYDFGVLPHEFRILVISNTEIR